MIGFIKKLFGSKPTDVTQPEAAPYKVEVAPTPVAEKAAEAVIKSVAKPAPKKPAATQKPAAPKKGPRKPKSKPQA